MAAAIQSLNPLTVHTSSFHGWPFGRRHVPSEPFVSPACCSSLAASAVLWAYVFSLLMSAVLIQSFTTESIIPVVYFEAVPLTGSPTFWTAERSTISARALRTSTLSSGFTLSLKASAAAT